MTCQHVPGQFCAQHAVDLFSHVAAAHLACTAAQLRLLIANGRIERGDVSREALTEVDAAAAGLGPAKAALVNALVHYSLAAGVVESFRVVGINDEDPGRGGPES